MPDEAPARIGRSTVFWLPWVFVLVGCGGPSPASRGAPIVVTAEPSAPLTAVPAVVRLRIDGSIAEPKSLVLIQGPLSSYYSDQLAAGELSSTLAPRRVAAYAWADSAAGDLVLAPSVPLDVGATYGVAALGVGLLATIVVDGDAPLPYGVRIWPPHGASGGARLVFCGAGVRVSGAPSVALDPEEARAIANPGADDAGIASSSCLRLDVSDHPMNAVGVPPPNIEGVTLDPSPVEYGGGTPALRAACADEEVVAGLGCVAVEDDRAVLRAAAAPLLWTLRVGGADTAAPLLSATRFVVKGLEPSSSVTVVGATTDLAGEETPFTSTWATLPPQPHLVVNEVLANPLGPEATAEWIELVNDGLVSVDVTGWTIANSTGTVTLPRGFVAPGAFAVVLSQGYVSSGLDVPIVPGTLLLRVPRIGRGLSNTGELIRLQNPGGALMSEFPALPSPRQGVSIARRTPSSLDDDVNAFGLSGGEGASPGAPNDLE